MDDLIYDAFSIFYQILQLFAPDHIGDTEFLLIGYTFGCVFVVVVLLSIFQIVSAFAKAIVSWFTRGS